MLKNVFLNPARINFSRIFFLILIVFFMGACRMEQESVRDLKINEGLPVVEVQLNSKVYQVELALSVEEQRIGLQNRDSLEEDKGMLFEFADSQVRNFWMKDTLIPLDIIYLDSQYKVVQIYDSVPTCESVSPGQVECPHYPSSGLVQYVLELKAGQAEKDGISIGDELRTEESQ